MSTTLSEDLSEETVRQIVTPDNVPVTVHIADLSTRMSALLIDFAILKLMIAIVAILFLVLSIAIFPGLGVRSQSLQLHMHIAIFISFVARITYFPLMESMRKGQTIGKKVMNIKVIDRNGGQLKTDSILIRNFVREVEFWLPGSALLSSQSGDAAFFWGAIFLLALCLIPLTNRERMRGGDMLAGTWVIKVPKEELLSDLSQTRKAFTNFELSQYGVEELHTLDYVLRQEGQHSPKLYREVANKIRNRIGRDQTETEDDKEFLTDFYTAQREFLENKKLLEGSAPDNKHTVTSSGQSGK